MGGLAKAMRLGRSAKGIVILEHDKRMKRLVLKSAGVIHVVAAATAGVWLSAAAMAQEGAQQSVKIQPYSGPPIYLDEQEQVATATIVRHEKIQDKYDETGNVRIEREIARFSDNHFEADGQYREYYPNGQLFVEGQFRRGRQEGEWTYYFDNGKVNRKAMFKNGLPDGPREIYRVDGTLAAKRGFKNGQRDGEWISYDATGKQPLREEHYVDGKQDGVWKIWFPGGRLKQEIGLKQGQRHGTSTEWDEQGEKRAELNFADGKLHGAATRWFPDGRVIVQRYNEGRLESQKSG
jgi:antitoxin component YwqK of YwqJK toxin-antitoxin module